ncbi:MAG TPA: bifunctional adenosylcobinamide kinase/adenosylcobinamide-phosphate guanylyltransferase [Anaerolineae bacterium]|nr:bifunctional adenosylcobinamide kinase/adenosylcobinamide-phosphate guanylyltransferase [Anaerolineae bacterium]HNT05240.1 bifunctional adenosylcobinamide kinase/adenosylcobinamide-phosphate guanylyltransferase [Anaerolineae bacterium]
MSQLILILGGARSGKSSYAEKLALELGGADVLYIATSQVLDEEMRQRVAVHRSQRPAGWRTLEAPLLTGATLDEAVRSARVVLVDCLTLLASNAILALGEEPPAREAEAAVESEVSALLAAQRGGRATWIIVSNEVGLGLVPPYPLGRVYRDALGRANQRLAAAADQVLLMVAGLPLYLKQP